MDQHFGKKKLSLKINSNDFFFCFENFYFEINSFLKTQFDFFFNYLQKKFTFFLVWNLLKGNLTENSHLFEKYLFWKKPFLEKKNYLQRNSLLKKKKKNHTQNSKINFKNFW